MVYLYLFLIVLIQKTTNRPFWLEKFNALSGQFTSLERELLANGNLFKEFLIEPVNVPLNPSIPTDSSKTSDFGFSTF